MNTTLHCDYLIIGGGIAGLSAALRCKDHGSVIIVSKHDPLESNSYYAQGGVSAALSPIDSPQKHFDDTMAAGHYHNVEEAVSLVTKEGPAHIQSLLDLGAPFDKDGDSLHLGKEAGHSESRIIHSKDATGKAIMNTLLKEVNSHDSIRWLDHTFVTTLLTDDSGCNGCTALRNQQSLTILSSFTVLATGGAGQAFEWTSNPLVATGDGLALGYEAGCTITDMEFVQFHPTTFCTDPDQRRVFLISEAIRGAGAYLCNQNHNEFMNSVHQSGSLATRDIVAREIFKESQSGQVTLHFDRISGQLKEQFPTIFQVAKTHGYTLPQDPLPITPAVHYMIGGIQTDLNGQSTVPRLYAIGEVACTGVHGANRLASNSLLEGLVFGARAADHMISTGTEITPVAPPPHSSEPHTVSRTECLKLRKEIQALTWNHCGIVRKQDSLQNAAISIEAIQEQLSGSSLDPFIIETQHLCQVASLLINAASQRKENCGCHYLSDSQNKNSEQYWIKQSKDKGIWRCQQF